MNVLLSTFLLPSTFSKFKFEDFGLFYPLFFVSDADFIRIKSDWFSGLSFFKLLMSKKSLSLN